MDRRPELRAAYSVELNQYRWEPNQWQEDFIDVIDYIGRPARRYGGAAAAASSQLRTNITHRQGGGQRMRQPLAVD
jgi:hypothetical protein